MLFYAERLENRVRIYIFMWLSKKKKKFVLLSQLFQSNANNFHTNWLIGLVGRVFANGPEDLGSIPGRVIPKTLKWYLIPPRLTLSHIRYVSRVKWSNLRKEVAPFPTSRCSSYWKGSLLVALDYGRLLYNLFLLYGFRYSYLILNCAQLYGFKYSYQIQIICKQLYGIKYSCLIQIICTGFTVSSIPI